MRVVVLHGERGDVFMGGTLKRVNRGRVVRVHVVDDAFGAEAEELFEAVQLVEEGGVAKGKRIMSEAGCRKALDLQVEGTDLVLGMPARFGLGFGLAGGMIPFPNPNSMFWGGYGGSLVVIDFDARTTQAYAMNKMAGTTTGDMRAFSLIMAMWTAMAAT